MREKKIVKGAKTRVVYAPSPSERETIDRLMAEVSERAEKGAGPSAHGFLRGRSPVTCALAHVGNFAWTLCLDLESFFDSIDAQHLKGRVPEIWLSDVSGGGLLHRGAPRQGLATSPALANIAAEPLDKSILRMIKKNYAGSAYTRYADDITVSAKSGSPEELLRRLRQLIGACRFKIAERKTKIFRRDHGARAVVVGVAVDADGIYPTRETKRRLRAAMHQHPLSGQARGLAEWAALRAPGSGAARKAAEAGGRAKAKAERDLARFVGWKYGDVPAARMPQALAPKADERIGALIITMDPVMLTGCSDFADFAKTTCLRKNGQHAGSALLWARMLQEHYARGRSGVGMAYIEDGETRRIANVTRPKMRARAFVVQSADGRRWHARPYGQTVRIRRALAEAGIEPVDSAPVGTVFGPLVGCPWVDGPLARINGSLVRG